MGNTAHASGGRRRATIEDVAASAGVSVATVSRAMRGLPNVALSTRERVLAIANELSYRPDPAAARLATGRARAIAVVVPLLNSWYFSQVVAGAEAVCAEEGYDAVVMGVSSNASRRALLDTTTSIHRKVDGLVFVDVALDPDDESTLADRNLALVSIGGFNTHFPSIGIDDVAVGDIATSHLLELGHRRIGLIAGQHHDPLDFQVPVLRRRGHLRALERWGVAADPSIEAAGNFSVVGGRDAMAAMLDLAEPPTAVFAMSDEMAFGALLAARQAGVPVPGELSVVGVDDHDVSLVMGLTTVRQTVADLGARATRMLMAQLNGAPAVATREETPIELIVRETTGAPAAPRVPPGHRDETRGKP
jgi:LacI family transcriptional regulator, repressor for deo operon, udp, cdd, tsx, nupC, and nupG